jgi:hypothetical protein
MSRRHCILAIAAVLVLAAVAGADETTLCNVFITSLPYTITAQGHYCLNRNLSTAQTHGAAITIASDFVTLDFNNFKLGGGAAGPGTTASGVATVNEDQRNITIRNGDIRGFRVGIFVAAKNLVVENNVVDGSTFSGIRADSPDVVVVRNNIVSNTGGDGSSQAIFAGGPLTLAQGNVVSNVFATSGTALGILLGENIFDHVVADHNLVQLGTAPLGTIGIESDSIQGLARDNTVVGGATAAYSNMAFIGNNYP